MPSHGLPFTAYRLPLTAEYWLLTTYFLIVDWGLPMRRFCAKPLVQANVSHYTIHSALASCSPLTILRLMFSFCETST